MRIFGLIILGFSSVSLIVLSVIFYSFYNALFQTDYLFSEYKSSGLYSSISNTIKAQVQKAQADSESEGVPIDPIQSQIQAQFIGALFSEDSVENLIENNLLRFKDFLESDQQTFTAYTPFSDSKMTNNMLSQMGMEELKNDPEFKKMFEESSRNMMSQNNPFQALSPMAQNVRVSLNILKLLLPILTAISLLFFVLVGKGFGRIRDIGILSILVSLSLGVSFFIWKTIYLTANQSGGWGEQNIGMQIASGILSPIIVISTSIIGKCSIFSLLIGVVCLVVWFVLKSNLSSASANKKAITKKRT
jgi:hypothetical protein